MRKSDSPCYNCEDRKEYGLCHDTCEKYQEYSNARKEIQDMKYNLNAEYRDYVRSHKSTYTSFTKKMRNH